MATPRPSMSSGRSRRRSRWPAPRPQPVYEIFANLQGRDLGSIAGEINKTIARVQKELSPGNTIQVSGRIGSMNDAFCDMGIGLVSPPSLSTC